MTKYPGVLSRVLAMFCTVCIVLMVVAVASDVTSRALMGRSVAGAYEVVMYSMVVVAFLSFANTELARGHIAVEFVVERLSERRRKALELVMLLLATGFVVILLWQSVEVASHSFAIREATFGSMWFPVWPLRIMVIVGLGGLTIQLLASIASVCGSLIQRRGFAPLC